MILPLTPSLLPNADAILQAAFDQPQSYLPEMGRYVELQPDGYFADFEGDQLAGVGGAVDYGQFAYVGLMAVHPNYQRRGIARRLMQHILAGLSARGMPAVLLDASPKGFPLYQSLGFHDVEDSSRYVQTETIITPPPPSAVRLLTAADLPALAALDTPVFGADRSQLFRLLLRDFPARAFAAQDETGQLSGFLFDRGHVLGPWVALREQDAEALLQAALNLPSERTLRLVIPAANHAAAALLPRYGFRRVYACRHMRLGEMPAPERRDLVWAQTSYAVG